MTRLAIVTAERDTEKARADRYWLALSDILAESPRVSPAERFTVEGQRFTLRAINRAMPLIVVTSKTAGASSTEVHALDTYAAECRDLALHVGRQGAG